VNRSLLNVVLHDQPFEQNAISAALLVAPPGPSKSARRIAKVVNTIQKATKKPGQ
jgi:predicted alpha/beta hydrolase family esterase